MILNNQSIENTEYYSFDEDDYIDDDEYESWLVNN